ncbi:C2 domain [Phytophthora cinnamomi]|uniref:C2 domain n=1 Tax=Phytophthora cinnamomi TaxID=4785 RepID=UPI00355A4D05|nr:C2 domain [Phytophthora cinnamomi]
MGLAPPPAMPQPSNNHNKPAPGAYDSPARPPSPAYDVGYDSSASDGSDSDAAASPQVEQLLVNHLRFAHAFRKNDAAMILQFLAKDVTLVSVDGARHEGQSAVLAYLVGARMTKISANLHVKGCPTRSGACQSTFIYEHGIVFKDPLYMEVLDWKPNSAAIVRIAHIALPDAKSGKTPQDFGKSSPLRLSFGTRLSDDEDSSEFSHESDASDTWEPENNNASTPPPVQMRCRRLKSNSSADCSAAMSAAAAATVRLSSSSSSSQNEAPVQPLAACTSSKRASTMITLAEISCTGLTPIRKRKTVNPFVILQCPEAGYVWKSPVMRRDPNPKWNHIPLKIPAHKLAEVVEISLWDHTFFRSVKVASAALVVSDILKSDAEFCTNIQLERYDAAQAAGEPQCVTMQLRFVRPCGGDMAFRSSDEVEQSPAQFDEPEKLEQAVSAGSALSTGVKWLVVDPFLGGHHASVLLMLVRAAIVAAIVWVLFHATLVWPMQA